MIGLITAVALAAAPENPGIAPPTPPPFPAQEERVPAPGTPAPAEAPHGSVEAEQAPDGGPATPGGQLGIVGLLGASVDLAVRTRATTPLGPPTTGPTAVGFGGIAGIGVRWGFFARTMERQWMPAVAVVTGSGFGPDGFSPFIEGRFEYLTVTGGGPLQPNFTLYASSGLTASRFGIYGGPPGVRPHVGFGFGWNWWPKGGGGTGGNWGHSLSGWNLGGNPGAIVAVPIALGIAAMVFAGRVEVQYTARPITGPGTDFVSVVLGVGG